MSAFRMKVSLITGVSKRLYSLVLSRSDYNRRISMAFKIITDSATDLPKEIIDEYQLHVIPTPVTINGTDYFDGKTIFPKDFYRIQSEGADIKTYHINQYMFRENFEPYAKAGDERGNISPVKMRNLRGIL